MINSLEAITVYMALFLEIKKKFWTNVNKNLI